MDRLDLARRWFGFEAHPGQARLLNAALPDGTRPRVLVAACGRRWGKTEALAVDVALDLLIRDGDILCCAPTRGQAEILFDRVEEKLRTAAELGAAAEFPALERLDVRRAPFCRLTLGRRRKLSSRTSASKGRNLRGEGYRRIIVDEAAFVDDAVITDVLKPMLATTPGGGELDLISTPWGRRGEFWRAFERGSQVPPVRRHLAFQFPSAQNPRVDPEYLSEQREDLPERSFRAEFCAEFLDDTGVVFPEAEIAAALIEESAGAADPCALYVAGVDFGRRSDFTVVAVLECGPVLRLVDLQRMQGLTWAMQLERVIEILARWGVREVAADRTGVGDPLAEALGKELIRRRLAAGVDEVLFTSASKPALIDGVTLALARGELKFPAYPDLLSELRAFTATPRPGGGEKLEAARGHDDCVCALALAVHAAAPYADLPGGPICSRVGLGGRLRGG